MPLECAADLAGGAPGLLAAGEVGLGGRIDAGLDAALRLGSLLAVFDGDYATTTVALGAHDPLQARAAATMAGAVALKAAERRRRPEPPNERGAR